MESMTSRQIAPFQALLNMIKINYDAKPEVFKTLVALLCDLHVSNEESAKKTKRYIHILLSENSDLAEILMSFLPDCTTPIPNWPTPTAVPTLALPGDAGLFGRQPDSVNPHSGHLTLRAPAIGLGTDTLPWFSSIGSMTTSKGKQVSQTQSVTVPNAGDNSVHPILYTRHPGLQFPLPLALPDQSAQFGGQLHIPQVPSRDKGTRCKSSASTTATQASIKNDVSSKPIPTWQSLTSSLHPSYPIVTTTAAQLAKTTRASLKRSVPALAFHSRYLTPLSKILSTAPPSKKAHLRETPTKQLTKEALDELNAPPRKIPRLHSKPVRERESLKVLTTKLKLACVEKRLETMRLAVTCAEKKLECEQKRLVCERKHLETVRLSQLYVDLLQPACTLAYDAQGPGNTISSGIPFQIQDPKTKTTIHTSARNLTSFPYSQKIILPDGEMHTVKM